MIRDNTIALHAMQVLQGLFALGMVVLFAIDRAFLALGLTLGLGLLKIFTGVGATRTASNGAMGFYAMLCFAAAMFMTVELCFVNLLI